MLVPVLGGVFLIGFSGSLTLFGTRPPGGFGGVFGPPRTGRSGSVILRPPRTGRGFGGVFGTARTGGPFGLPRPRTRGDGNGVGLRGLLCPLLGVLLVGLRITYILPLWIYIV